MRKGTWYAGELLALLGPLSPSAVAFHTHALARPVTESSTSATDVSSVSSKGFGASARQPAGALLWLPSALRQLHAALLDADVGVIKVAQVTLRCVPDQKFTWHAA